MSKFRITAADLNSMDFDDMEEEKMERIQPHKVFDDGSAASIEQKRVNKTKRQASKRSIESVISKEVK